MSKLIDGSPVLPVYLICDTSISMNEPVDGSGSGVRRIDVLNEAINDLFIKIYQGSRTTLRVEVSVISFNSEPCLNLPLQSIGPDVEMSPLQPYGFTVLAKALDFFNDRLTVDEEAQPGGRFGYRPVAFVITDGHPLDKKEAWEKACARLAARRKPSLPPRIVPCMVGDPCKDLLNTLIAFYGKDLTSISSKVIIDSKDIAGSIHSVFNSIAQTLNYSAGAVEAAASGSYDDQVNRMETAFQKALADPANKPPISYGIWFLDNT
jgi:von willebrand factor type A domain